MSRFSDRVAVVTGGAGGIGAATALAMARDGAIVALLDLNEHAAQEVASTISQDQTVKATSGSAFALACDVTDADEVAASFASVKDRHDRLDILVNNAGITRDNLLFKMSVPEWEAVLATNLTSAFLCSREAQKYMVSAHSGRIVNLSSRSALGNRGQANYAAAKAGIQGLTATLALELGPYNINVNAVAPGYIATAMTAATAIRVGSTPEEHQRMAAERTPLGRVGRPEEIASVVCFLASDEASYVSGQTLYVNGGAR